MLSPCMPRQIKQQGVIPSPGTASLRLEGSKPPTNASMLFFVLNQFPSRVRNKRKLQEIKTAFEREKQETISGGPAVASGPAH